MKVIKSNNTSESKTILFYFLFVACVALLFVKGINSFISSSEFWSIYLSQKIFTLDPNWRSVYLKPAFHGLLSVIYLLPLNDFFHIYATKIIFSLNGALQFYILFRLISTYHSQRLINLMMTVFLFCSPLYLANFDRVRSDQVALTFLLLFFYLRTFNFRRNKEVLLAIALSFPFFAFKHIYFSLICIPFLPVRYYWNRFSQLSLAKRTILSLLTLNLLIWTFAQAYSAFYYFVSSFERYFESITFITSWIKSEWFYFYLSLIPYFISDYWKSLRSADLEFLPLSQFLIIAIIFIHPQKFTFFLASFLPIFYLNGVFFFLYLLERKIVPFKILFLVLFCATAYGLYLGQRYHFLFTTNKDQLIAIERISKIVSENRLTYLDGMGILPRGNNVGCFVSPDDEVANSACLNKIQGSEAQAIIVTNRLMGLSYDFSNLEKLNYVSVGPNLFLKKELIGLVKNEVTSWMPPALLFTTEQIY